MPPRAFDSRAGFHTALAWGFETAIAQDSRRILCCDPDFATWAWDDAVTLARLTAWLRQPQRRLVLLAGQDGALARCHPRFERWRRDWSHAITGQVVVDEPAPTLPSLLVADRGISVQLLDAVHWRGRADDDERVAHGWRVALEALLQRSEPGFAVKTLGL